MAGLWVLKSLGLTILTGHNWVFQYIDPPYSVPSPPHYQPLCMHGWYASGITGYGCIKQRELENILPLRFFTTLFITISLFAPSKNMETTAIINLHQLANWQQTGAECNSLSLPGPVRFEQSKHLWGGYRASLTSVRRRGASMMYCPRLVYISSYNQSRFIFNYTRLLSMISFVPGCWTARLQRDLSINPSIGFRWGSG